VEGVDSSALSGISSKEETIPQSLLSQRRWQAVGLTEEFRANNVRPYRFPSLKMGNRLLCPIGHLLYRGDDYAKPPLLEEVASRRLDGGVMHPTKTPHPFPMKRPKSQQPFGGDAAMIGK
jgi:hypothetical protein